jgi:DnaJ family protein A protein 2
MTPEQIKAIESVLPKRNPTSLPPPDAMTEDFALDSVDPTREQARARGMAMDEDEDDMHPGAERVQCASQ